MEQAAAQRRLAAIVALDVVGFSKLMGRDEEGTLRRMLAFRAEIAEPTVAAHGGRLFKHMGDGALGEFPSVVEALACTDRIHGQLASSEATRPESERMRLRVAIHLGEVLIEGEDAFGDGVNIAARLQPLASPGGTVLSGTAYEQVASRVAGRADDQGLTTLKNIARPVRVVALASPGEVIGSRQRLLGRLSRRRGILSIGAAALAIALVAAIWFARREMSPEAQTEPTVVVLPFTSEGGAEADRWLGAGLSTEVTAALSRFPELAVISPQAAQGFADRAGDLEALHRELGATYVVTGSLRHDGPDIRVAVQLVELPRGVTRWSETYREPAGAIATLEQQLVLDVAGRLAIKLGRLEEARAGRRPAENGEVYDLYLRGRVLTAARDRRSNREAREILQRATEADPTFAPAWAARGWAAYYNGVSGWTEFMGATLAEAESFAQTALQRDSANASAQALMGFIYLNRGQYQLAEAAASRAIALNPSDAASYEVRAAVQNWSGQNEAALATLETARRFDPDLGSLGLVTKGFADLQLGRNEAAISDLEQLVSRDPTPVYAVMGRVGLAIAYGQLGNTSRLDAVRVELRRLSPFFNVAFFVRQFSQASDQAWWLERLKAAGLVAAMKQEG